MWLYNIFKFGACDRFAPSWHDFELELNLDDQGSGRYQHIKKIRNEKLKWIWKKKRNKERIGNRMQHFEDERDTKRKKEYREIAEKNKEKGNRWEKEEN